MSDELMELIFMSLKVKKIRIASYVNCEVFRLQERTLEKLQFVGKNGETEHLKQELLEP